MTKIQLKNVVVDIPIFGVGHRSLKNNLLAAATGGQIRSEANSKQVVVRPIDDVSLTIEHGARLGLLGHNGAGKSTLLRVLAGIYEPTAGSIEVQGDVASMFDIGFGMDPDASGWDNIILRGMFLGYSKVEITSRSEEIAAVTGLGEFLNMPLRTYSAGMATRLAFAVSTSIRPDILLIDEGIGAGDAAFLVQANERMKTFIGEAGIMVMASHSNNLLRDWCEEGLWMEHGRIKMQGPIEEVLVAYEASIHG